MCNTIYERLMALDQTRSRLCHTSNTALKSVYLVYRVGAPNLPSAPTRVSRPWSYLIGPLSEPASFPQIVPSSTSSSSDKSFPETDGDTTEPESKGLRRPSSEDWEGRGWASWAE